MGSWGKTLALLLVALFLTSTFMFQLATVKAQVKTITVPDDFATIQTAVNSAQPGDTILVTPGTYYEHVIINKPLTLLGEDKTTTIIDGSYSGNPVSVNANNVIVANFTIQNSGWNLQWGAIYISGGSFNVTIANNNLVNNEYGVLTDQGSYTLISNNFISGNQTYNLNNSDSAGILLFSDRCTAKCNIIQQVDFGIMINGNYNLIYNNTLLGSFQNDNGSFNGSANGIGILCNKRLSLYFKQESINYTVIGNTIAGWDFQLALGGINGWVFLQNNVFGGFLSGVIGTNTWDNGYPAGGNYWSLTSHIDVNHGPYQNITGADGICDNPYIIGSGNIDHYPFVNPITNITIVPTEPAPLTDFTPTPSPSATPDSNGLTQTQLTISCQKINDFQVTISGTLGAGSRPLPYTGLIIFSYSLDNGQNWTPLVAAATDINGHVSVPWAPTASGNYLVKAQWQGNATFAGTSNAVSFVFTLPSGVSVSKYPTSYPTLTQIAISCQKINDYQVTIGGTLSVGISATLAGSTPLANQTLYFSYSVDNGQNWNWLTTAQTNINGFVSVPWNPMVSGNYLVKVQWQGNATFAGSSKIVSFPFTLPSGISVASNSTVTNLYFNATAKVLQFTVNETAGATGSIQAEIPKLAIADPSALKVYLDGNQTAYTVTSQQDTWIISLACNINLNSQKTTPQMPSNILTPNSLEILSISVGALAALAIVIVVIVRKRKEPQPALQSGVV